MSLLDFLRGIRRPSSDSTPQPEPSLRDALLALGTDADPFVVRVSRPGEPGQLVAEWKIVDARWFELFARAGLRKTFAIFLVLDAARHTVRGLDRSTTLQWRAGVPSPSADGEVEWGRQMTAEAAIGFGFRDDLSYGPVYRYAFRSKDLKQLLWTTVLDHGWIWQAVGPGGL